MKFKFSVLHLFILLSFYACSPSESTRNVNAESIQESKNIVPQTETPVQSVSNTEVLEKDYYRFKGMINENLPVVLDLNQENGNYVGSYYYTKHKMILRFDGKKNENGEIVLQIYDKLGNIAEYITGRINQNTFIGKWQNADRTKTFPVSLTETLDRSILFYIEDVAYSDIVSIRQVPKDGNLALAQKSILKAQGFDFSTNKELEDYVETKKKIAAKEKLKESNEEGMTTHYNKSISVIFNDFSIGTLYFYTMGLNSRLEPFVDNSYVMIDGFSGKRIMIKDIFNDKNIKVIEEKTKNQEDCGYVISLDNFYISEKGIIFYCKAYSGAMEAMEMAAEEEDRPKDLLLKWSEIKDLIKEDSPVRRIFEN